MIACIKNGLFRVAYKIEGKLDHQPAFVTAAITPAPNHTLISLECEDGSTVQPLAKGLAQFCLCHIGSVSKPPKKNNFGLSLINNQQRSFKFSYKARRGLSNTIHKILITTKFIVRLAD